MRDPPALRRTFDRLQDNVASNVSLDELAARGRRAAEVTTLVGFSDQSHLQHHFRYLLGMTPGQYARATRGNSTEPS